VGVCSGELQWEYACCVSKRKHWCTTGTPHAYLTRKRLQEVTTAGVPGGLGLPQPLGRQPQGVRLVGHLNAASRHAAAPATAHTVGSPVVDSTAVNSSIVNSTVVSSAVVEAGAAPGAAGEELGGGRAQRGHGRTGLT